MYHVTQATVQRVVAIFLIAGFVLPMIPIPAAKAHGGGHDDKHTPDNHHTSHAANNDHHSDKAHAHHHGLAIDKLPHTEHHDDHGHHAHDHTEEEEDELELNAKLFPASHACELTAMREHGHMLGVPDIHENSGAMFMLCLYTS